MFNNNSVILDNQLKFDDHLKMTSGKISKTIAPLDKLQKFLAKAAVIIIYKAFIRPHLDYGDILFTKSWNPFSIMPAWP